MSGATPSIYTKPRYSMKEAAQLLGLGERTLARRVNEGAIESHLDGDRRFVSARAIDAYVKGLEANSGCGLARVARR